MMLATMKALVSCVVLAQAAVSTAQLRTFLSPEEFSKRHFDFLVVGGGTSGLVVATRLSEIPSFDVGVIEAGQYSPNDPSIELPINYGSVFGNAKYEWLYATTPQSALNGRVIQETVGKVLGGSSAICDVLWQRGSAEEYDIWGTELGNGPSWSFEGLVSYFRKAENWTGPPIVLPGQKYSEDLYRTHGVHGPVQVGYNNFFPDPIAPSVASANALGIRTNSNPDSGNPTGYQTPARAVNPASGRRSYTVSAYLEPNLKRKNLAILTGALVSKINFKSDGRRSDVVASGVEYIASGKKYNVSVKKEVVLAAGSLGTPRVLELSGIGDRRLLQKLGIRSVVDLPVGENLMDQTYVAMDYVARPGVRTLDQLRINATFFEEQQTLFNQTGTGALTYDTAAVATTPLQTIIPKSDLAGLSALLDRSIADRANTPLQRAQYNILKKQLSRGTVGWMEFLLLAGGGGASLPQGNTSYITPFAFHLWPLSRGSVHINSSDPDAPPVIDPKYLSNPFDLAVHSLSATWMRRWMSTAPISNMIEGYNVPSGDVQDPTQFESYIRNSVSTTFHPVGTTPLAPRSLGGVVDPSLRVYDVPNLRIVDAGIHPLTIGVAPLATVYAIAEKAADIIKSTSH